MATKKSRGKTTKRPVHVVSSGKGRNRPSAGLRQKPSRPKPEEATTPRSSSKPKPKPKLTEKNKDKGNTYTYGLTVKAVNADDTLSATEKKRIIAIINRNKAKGGEV